MRWERVRNALRWASLRDKLQTNLWVRPLMYMLAAAGLALLLLHADSRIDRDVSAWFIYGGHADGATALLSTVASAMFNIAGVVFSITIVALQLASSQFSPRVLRTFLSDSATQRSLGLFLGTFIYAMVVLPQVHQSTAGHQENVPGLAVFGAFVLVLFSAVSFVRYIHHMAHSIRAVNIIVRVSAETRACIARLYPDALRDAPPHTPALPAGDPQHVVSNRGGGGVVISMDEDAIMHAAQQGDLVVHVLPRMGQYVPMGAPLCHVYGRFDEDELSASDWVVLADERTMHQDAIFGFRQLVDIAERALSPGINDPTTATQALDRLHDLLRTLAERELPGDHRVDEEGRLRLVAPRPSWPDYLHIAFEEICIYGADSVQVMRRARFALQDLLTVTQGARAAAVAVQLSRVEAAALRSGDT